MPRPCCPACQRPGTGRGRDRGGGHATHAADPGTALPYRVVDGDDWWVADPASELYNSYAQCLPGTCPCSEAAGEDLYAAGPVYDHAVVIDYNRGGTPGA
ncbi:hypothetical protein [Modestobacter sp. DSM 44400]|uniref:hypothetical protein n=1 Tax=Modestobacter sp. DSM 44400 TaxID=1550230 RepID=UPI00111511DA|nr:hypothetical protein [Modestobacter sp. DSM 44400]